MAKNAVSAVPAPVVPSARLDPGEILTLSECAERLKVSDRTIYELTRSRCQNPIPTRRVGRSLRFIWADVCDWMGGAA